MRALYKKDSLADSAELLDMPIPEIRDDEDVLVKVLRANICGMDRHIMKGSFPCTPPFIMGHEFVGTVEKTGSKAGTSFKAGDRVVAEPHLFTCGKCSHCRHGVIHLCHQRRSLGISMDGAFAEYLIVPAPYLHQVPDAISDKVAPLIEPYTLAMTDAVIKSGFHAGERVLITGSGQIGILCALALRLAGASTIIMSGVDSDEPVRFPLAHSLGVDRTVNVLKEDLEALVKESTDHEGVDLVVEASGAESAINTAIRCLRPNGRLCAIGGTKRTSIAIDWDYMLSNAISLYFNMMCDYSAIEQAIRTLERCPYDLSVLISKEFSLDDWRAAFDYVEKEEGIKTQLLVATG